MTRCPFSRVAAAVLALPLPGQDYYTTFINNGGATESITFTMAGEGALTGYEGWIASFGLTGPDADPDAINNFDGVRHLVHPDRYFPDDALIRARHSLAARLPAG